MKRRCSHSHGIDATGVERGVGGMHRDGGWGVVGREPNTDCLELRHQCEHRERALLERLLQPSAPRVQLHVRGVVEGCSQVHLIRRSQPWRDAAHKQCSRAASQAHGASAKCHACSASAAPSPSPPPSPPDLRDLSVKLFIGRASSV